MAERTTLIKLRQLKERFPAFFNQTSIACGWSLSLDWLTGGRGTELISGKGQS